MKINPFQISFKQNNDGVKASTSDTLVPNSVFISNPLLQKYETQGTKLPQALPTYNVKTPMKYTYTGEKQLPYGTKIHLYKLENGQRVAIIPKSGSTVVKTYVNSGSMNEPDNQRGISHFIEHNLFNGSRGLGAGEFFEKVNKMGANTNASTGFAETNYYISSHLLKKNDLEEKIKIHASMIESPTFALDMLEKEKGPVTSEINMILDDPENIATNETVKSLYGIKSTSKDIIGGTVDNIKRLTQADVVDYYQRNYSPSEMVTVISGEVDPETTMGLISKHFSAQNVGRKPRIYEALNPIQTAVRKDIISDKATSAVISLGFNGPKNNDSRGKALTDAIQFFLIGSSISRLNKRLQEINSNAFVNSDRISTKPEDGRVILFSTLTSECNVENVIKMIFREISELENHPPTDQELDIVKKKLKLAVAQIFESSEATNSVVGSSMLDRDLKSITKFEKFIDTMTSQDIVNFARQYLDLEKVAITVVHPATTDEKAIKENYRKENNISFMGNDAEINHKQALDLSKIKQYVASNNLSITTNETPSDMSTLDLSFSATLPADVKPGVSNILSIILSRGSKFRDEKEFFSQLERQGISTTFNASEREINVSSMFLAADGVDSIKTAKEAVFNPRFTQEDLNYAKKVIRETVLNTPKNAREALFSQMFKGQFYGVSGQDILTNIDNISIDDVKGLHQYIMTNAQGRAAISAPLEKNPELKTLMFNELSSDFPNLHPSTASLFNGFIPVKEKSVVLQEHNKSQAEIQVGYKFKTSGNVKDVVVFELLNTILGGTASSRLFMDLREKQKLAYQVNSQLASFDNSGTMSLCIKTTTDNAQTGETPYDNLQKSIDGFNFHTQKLVNENVSTEELENAKLSLKTKILNSDELTSGKNTSIINGQKSFYGFSRDNQALDLIDSITVEDIKAAANYMFNLNPTYSIVATKNTLEKNQEYINKLGKIVDKR